MNSELCICSFAKTWNGGMTSYFFFYDFVFLWYNAEVVINVYTKTHCNSNFNFLFNKRMYFRTLN